MNDVSRRAVLMSAGGLLMAGAQGALPVAGPAGRAPGTIELGARLQIWLASSG